MARNVLCAKGCGAYAVFDADADATFPPGKPLCKNCAPKTKTKTKRAKSKPKPEPEAKQEGERDDHGHTPVDAKAPA